MLDNNDNAFFFSDCVLLKKRTNKQMNNGRSQNGRSCHICNTLEKCSFLGQGFHTKIAKKLIMINILKLIST